MNVIDPVFDTKKNCLNILEYILDLFNNIRHPIQEVWEGEKKRRTPKLRVEDRLRIA